MAGLFGKIGGWRGAVGFAVAFALAGTAGWRLMKGESAVASEAEIVEALDGMAMQGPARAMYSEVKRSYPEDWKAFVQLMVDGYRTDPDPQSGRRIGFEWGQKFIQARTSEALASPAPELSRTVAAEVALLDVLKVENPDACADMVWSGRVAPADTAALSPTATTRMAEYQAAVIAAAAASKRQPTKYLPVSAADAAAMRAGLTKIGASPQTLAVMASPDTAAHNAEEACSAGVEMVKAVATLQPQVQATFAAAMLKSAMAAGTPAP